MLGRHQLLASALGRAGLLYVQFSYRGIISCVDQEVVEECAGESTDKISNLLGPAVRFLSRIGK